MKMCSSESCWAVRVNRGSTVTMRTPFFFASLRYCGVPVPNVPSAGLQPHIRISFELT
jgi:hypothetical protein